MSTLIILAIILYVKLIFLCLEPVQGGVDPQRASIDAKSPLHGAGWGKHGGGWEN